MSGGKMIRKLLILLCLLTLMLNGCASEKTKQTAAQENDTEEDSGEKKIQIGLTVDSFVIERWIRDRDVFVATARELGAEVNVQDAGADTKEQISQIDYFIKKHMDVIVIIAREKSLQRIFFICDCLPPHLLHCCSVKKINVYVVERIGSSIFYIAGNCLHTVLSQLGRVHITGN